MRRVANVKRTSTGEPLPYVIGDDTTNEAAIVGENTTISNTGVVYSRKSLGAFKYASGVYPVSVELWQDAAIDINADINDVVVTRLLRRQNKDFTTGDGTNKPTGFLVSCGADTTADGTAAADISYDNLVDLQHSVDEYYRTGASWMFNNQTCATLRKLKDSTGQPIWQQGLIAGQPSLLLGDPVVINNHMPAATSGLRPIAYGQFNKYQIRDVADVNYMVLKERWAEDGEIGIIAYWRADGILKNTAAIQALIMQ
jgi:HK97 family phage major capsid protein